jgi:hypothetical protein
MIWVRELVFVEKAVVAFFQSIIDRKKRAVQIISSPCPDKYIITLVYCFDFSCQTIPVPQKVVSFDFDGYAQPHQQQQSSNTQ